MSSYFYNYRKKREIFFFRIQMTFWGKIFRLCLYLLIVINLCNKIKFQCTKHLVCRHQIAVKMPTIAIMEIVHHPAWSVTLTSKISEVASKKITTTTIAAHLAFSLSWTKSLDGDQTTSPQMTLCPTICPKTWRSTLLISEKIIQFKWVLSRVLVISNSNLFPNFS